MHLLRILPAALAFALAAPFSSLTAAAPTTLDLSHQLDEERAERLEKLIERFNSRQKDYEVKLVRRVQGDPPKDLNLVTREEQARFVAAKANFKPLHQVMKEANMPFEAGKLAPELRVGLGDAKGELFALPIGLSTPVLFINKAAFRKAGLDPEKPPKTWAEMLKAADKLFDAGSTCPYTTSWPSWVHIDNLSSWNGVEVSDAKGRLNFNGLVQVKHTAMLTTWAKARFFIYFGRRDEADNRFAAGECGMLTSSSSLYGPLHESRKVEVGVSSLPYHDDVPGAPQQTMAGGYSLWVGAGQKPAEYKGVAQFVSFLMEPELQVEFSAVAGFLPMTPAARAAAGSKLLKADTAGLNVAYAQLQGPGALRALRVSENERVRIIAEEELEAAWTGKIPAKQALDNAVQRGNLVLSGASKAPGTGGGTTPEEVIAPRLGWRLPHVFAHRCGGALAPENTLAGLRIAARLGLRAVEFDVMLSADASPWLLHDETLARTTNGAGRVCETSDAELSVLDAGIRQHPAFAGEPLPTLASAALVCRQLGLLANVEIKPAAGFDALTGEVVARAVRALWAGAALPLLSSFSETALAAARAAVPELPLGMLHERPPADWRERLRQLAAVTLHCRADCLDDELLGEARAHGIPVLCYTVNDPALASALHRRGVAAVFSDRIDCVAEG